MSLVRLFFAVRLSSQSATEVSGIASRLKKHFDKEDTKITWMNPINYHVTLRYLGEHSEFFAQGLTEKVSTLFANERPASFGVAYKGLGTFPDPAKAKVLWMGLESSDGGLSKLSELVDGPVEKMGVEPREKPFLPHVTLGRSGRPFDAMSAVQGQSERMFSKSRIKSLELLKTQKISNGYMYKKIASWPLN